MLAGCLLYVMLINMIDEEVTEKLIVNTQRIANKIESGESIPQLSPVIEIEKLQEHQPTRLYFKDTVLYDPIEQESEIFREVTSIKNIKGSSWRICVRQVILESHDYLGSIGLSLTIIMALLLFGLFVINRTVSKTIWKSFYSSLVALRQFELHDEKPVSLVTSNILEFEELNQAIQKLTSKARSDYHALKEFTENASHEMQTPLSIIQSKLDLLSQTPSLSKQEAAEIETATVAINRMAKLNDTLLLLAKIENNQFPDVDYINLETVIKRQLKNLQVFIQAKNLIIKTFLNKNRPVEASTTLAEALVSNLLQNAIKHNIDGGTIKIELNDERFTISNTGEPLKEPPKKMFDRFVKWDKSSQSLGLGLSIVKKICEVNSWELNYTVQGNWHMITIIF
jgi:signal transduction histidine kinase